MFYRSMFVLALFAVPPAFAQTTVLPTAPANPAIIITDELLVFNKNCHEGREAAWLCQHVLGGIFVARSDAPATGAEKSLLDWADERPCEAHLTRVGWRWFGCPTVRAPDDR